MKLYTKRLTLVPLCPEHFETTCLYSMDSENTVMMCFLPCDDQKEVMDYLIKSDRQWKTDIPEYLDMAVVLDGEHIGAVSIEFLEDHTVGELGWIIRKDHWGNGYALESAKVFMDYCAERFQLRRFIAHCDSENIPSMRVMEKLGMNFREKYKGRKNRNSEELREECLYEMFI